MSERIVYHVVPHDTEWKLEADRHYSEKIFKLKEEAIQHTKEIAKKQSQVIIHHKDGTIETEYTYKDDPVHLKHKPCY